MIRRRWVVFLCLLVIWVSILVGTMIIQSAKRSDANEALGDLIFYGVGGLGAVMLIEYAILAAVF
jgi:hypothetical protein